VDCVAKSVKIVLLVGLLALLLGGAASCISRGEAESKVDWLYSMDEALSEAQSDNKPVMIDFYGDWCPPCKEMDRNTYSDDELGAFVNDNFVPLKVDVNKSNLHSTYGIEKIPQVVFLSPQGSEIDKGLRILGYWPPDAFHQELQAVLDAWSPPSP
jgi:thiol:disulfide interchange protein